MTELFQVKINDFPAAFIFGKFKENKRGLIQLAEQAIFSTDNQVKSEQLFIWILWIIGIINSEYF